MIIEAILIILGILVLLGWLVLEIPYHSRPGNALEITPADWNIELFEPQHYFLRGELTLSNPTANLEVMVPELSAEVSLLSKAGLQQVQAVVRVVPHHPDAEARPDGYWFGYIIKSRKQTQVELTIDIQGVDLAPLTAAWVRVHYVSYGPKGRLPRVHHEVVPLRFPDPQESPRWRPVPQGDVLPIKTHLLTQLDRPVAVVERYVLPHAHPGDIVTIGETPIAIMQGRWHHPSSIQPGWVARRVCHYFHPTSSLATACGLQALVDIVGPGRVLFAFFGGVLLKLIGQPGGFYRLAGEQARLIDDVTGTLPPYDQFIVLGPEHPQRVVEQIKAETGLSAAIVDVNDLKRVKILAATPEVDQRFLTEALRLNPAGNADEQTPVVLIRPT